MVEAIRDGSQLRFRQRRGPCFANGAPNGVDSALARHFALRVTITMLERHQTVAAFVAAAAIADCRNGADTLLCRRRERADVSQRQRAHGTEPGRDDPHDPTTSAPRPSAKVGFFTTDGKVDAQPLLLSGVPDSRPGDAQRLFTSRPNTTAVYAFDSDSRAVAVAPSRCSAPAKSPATAGTARRSCPRSASRPHRSSTRRVVRTA